VRPLGRSTQMDNTICDLGASPADRNHKLRDMVVSVLSKRRSIEPLNGGKRL
jgi:hypothetical protein